MNEQQIKDLMKKKRLTVGKLAKRFDVSHTTIHFLIRRRMRSRPLEKRMARALGVKLGRFLGNEETAA